jgi:ATP-dependent Clp protease ATP-binding subunit ClpA
VLNPLALRILSGEFKEGDKVKVHESDQALSFKKESEL